MCLRCCRRSSCSDGRPAANRDNRADMPVKSKVSRDDDDAELSGGGSARIEQIGVRSVEGAGRLLKPLAALQGPQTLSALAAAAGLPPAKAHRYLVSLIREGFVEQ